MDACLDQEIVGLDLLAQPVVGSLSFWMPCGAYLG